MASGAGDGGRQAGPEAYSETLPVRYSDTDAQAHLYFANYLVYADEVGGHYMEALGLPVMNPQRAPCYFFTVNVNCDYISECGAGDLVRVSVGYTRLGSSSAELAFQLADHASGAVLARGSITQVFVDKKTRRAGGIPPEYRAAIVSRQPELAGDAAAQ